MTRFRPPAQAAHRGAAADAVLNPHADIEQYFTAARSARSSQEDPRRPFAKCDTFLATLSRHLAAVEDVVFPEARRRLPEGPRLVAQHVRLSRALERTMRALEGSFYGDAYYPADVRDLLWDRMNQLLRLHDATERDLIHALGRQLDPRDERKLGQRFTSAVQSAPTRPHPYSPHSTWLSPAQHRLWAIADRAMDSMDNRIIPNVRKPIQADPDSLLSQYLTGSPRFAED